MGENGKRIGLALSGGGYRAAAYHLGTLRALHKMGLLEKVDVISSVSGGSIIAAFYLLHKDEPFEQIEQSFRKCLAHSSLWGAILNLAIVFLLPALLGIFVSGWFLFLYLLLYWGFYLIPSSKWIALYYDRLFFRKKKLKDLPDSTFRTFCERYVYISRKKEKYPFFSQTHIFVPNIGIILKITKYPPG